MRQLLHLAEELPDAAHALNVCTILHRLAKGGSAGRSQGGEEWDWEALGIFDHFRGGNLNPIINLFWGEVIPI